MTRSKKNTDISHVDSGVSAVREQRSIGEIMSLSPFAKTILELRKLDEVFGSAIKISRRLGRLRPQGLVLILAEQRVHQLKVHFEITRAKREIASNLALHGRHIADTCGECDRGTPVKRQITHFRRQPVEQLLKRGAAVRISSGGHQKAQGLGVVRNGSMLAKEADDIVVAASFGEKFGDEKPGNKFSPVRHSGERLIKRVFGVGVSAGALGAVELQRGVGIIGQDRLKAARLFQCCVEVFLLGVACNDDHCTAENILAIRECRAGGKQRPRLLRSGLDPEVRADGTVLWRIGERVRELKRFRWGVFPCVK
jgi:hypothetical protein